MPSLDPLRSNQSVSTTKTQGSKTNTVSADNAKVTAKSAKQDAFSISDQGKMINNMSQKLAKEVPVNASKVAALKESVEQGSYEVDSKNLARNMLNMERNINKG